MFVIQVPKGLKAGKIRWHPYPVGISLGEVLLWATLAGLLIFWVVYWRVVFTYMIDKMRTTTLENFEAEYAGRISGHISSILSGLLLLPASRTGLWVEVFAVPYERMLKYHRILGALAYACVTIHGCAWWSKWWKEGNLGHNIFAYRDLQFSNYRVAKSDYSTTIAEVTWTLMTVNMLMAIFLRRRQYAIFQYSHKFIGIIYYVSAIVHGWNFWYDP